jgi:hypothetical protein
MARAERQVKEPWQAKGWEDGALAESAKSHPLKVRLAKRLGRETTMRMA